MANSRALLWLTVSLLLLLLASWQAFPAVVGRSLDDGRLAFYPPVSGAWADEYTDLVSFDWSGATSAEALSITLWDMHGGVFEYSTQLEGRAAPEDSEVEVPLSAFRRTGQSSAAAFNGVDPRCISFVAAYDPAGKDDFSGELEFIQSGASWGRQLSSRLSLAHNLATRHGARGLNFQDAKDALRKGDLSRADSLSGDLRDALRDLDEALERLERTRFALESLGGASGRRLGPLQEIRQLNSKLGRDLNQARTPSAIGAVVRQIDAVQRQGDSALAEILGAPLQEGVSYRGFGHFGWSVASGAQWCNFTGEGLALTSPGKPRFELVFGVPGAERAPSDFESDRLPDFLPAGETVSFDWRWPGYKDASADWTTAKLRWNYEVAGGPVPLSLTWGELAPGALLSTEAASLEFSARGAGSPLSEILIPAAQGLVRLPAASLASYNPAALVAGWIIALWGSGPSAQPVQLVFQHRPLALRLERGALIVDWAGPGGYVGVAPLPWTEQQALANGEVVASLLRNYPVRCIEWFVTREDSVWVRDQYDYVRFADDFGSKPVDLAPIPPWVSTAIARGLPVRVLAEPLPAVLSGKWGPCRYVEANAVEYTLPLPRGGHYVALRPARDNRQSQALDDWARDWLDDQTGWLASPRQMPRDVTMDGWSQIAQCWSFLSQGTRWQLLDKWPRAAMGALIPESWRLRVEPLSGSQYWVCSEWGRIERDDQLAPVGPEIARALYGLADFARYTGRWEELAQKGYLIDRMAQYLSRASGWAVPAPGALESGERVDADTLINSYGASLAYAKLAAALGKQEKADFGWYLAARLSIALLLRFEGFGFPSYEAQMTGPLTVLEYDEHAGPRSVGRGASDLLMDLLAAPTISPETADLYVEVAPVALARLAGEAAQSGGRGEDDLFSFLAARCALSASPEEVEPLFSAWGTKRPSLEWWPQYAWAMGYRAPVSLSEWLPGRLDDMRFDLATGGIEVDVNSGLPFTLTARLPAWRSLRPVGGSTSAYSPWDDSVRLLSVRMSAGQYSATVR